MGSRFLPSPAWTTVLFYAYHCSWDDRSRPPYPGFSSEMGSQEFIFCPDWPGNISLPSSLGWQAQATMPSYCLRLGLPNFLSGLASSHDPTNLSLSRSWDYRCEPECPATVRILNQNYKARERNKKDTTITGRNQIIPSCRWYCAILKGPSRLQKK
jgi:hypothetical protein